MPKEILQNSEEAYSKYGKVGDFKDPLKALSDNLSKFENILLPKPLDLNAPSFEGIFKPMQYDFIHVGNVLHVSPLSATEGFFRFASFALRQDGIVTLYGPFKRFGEFTTPSNQEFDMKLKERNSIFGLRDIDSEVIPVATTFGFQLEDIFEMPKNNFLMKFSKL